MDRNGFVYLLVHKTEPRFKIGTAVDVLQRNRQLGEAIAIDQSFAANGSLFACFEAEKALHRLFWKDRLPKMGICSGSTEWFHHHCLPRALSALEIFGQDLGLDRPISCRYLLRVKNNAKESSAPHTRSYEHQYREDDTNYLKAITRLFEPCRLVVAGILNDGQESLWAATRADEEACIALDFLPRYLKTESFLLVKYSKLYASLCRNYPDGYWIFDIFMPEVCRRVGCGQCSPLLAELIEIVARLKVEPMRHPQKEQLMMQYLNGHNQCAYLQRTC